MKILVCSIIIAMAAAVVTANAQVLPANAKFRGKSYAEWSAAWFQWAINIPINHLLHGSVGGEGLRRERADRFAVFRPAPVLPAGRDAVTALGFGMDQNRDVECL